MNRLGTRPSSDLLSRVGAEKARTTYLKVTRTRSGDLVAVIARRLPRMHRRSDDLRDRVRLRLRQRAQADDRRAAAAGRHHLTRSESRDDAGGAPAGRAVLCDALGALGTVSLPVAMPIALDRPGLLLRPRPLGSVRVDRLKTFYVQYLRDQRHTPD